MRVSEQKPPSCSLISWVRVVKPSDAVVGSMSMRHVVTSLWGGSASITSPSMMTSGNGQPISAEAAFIFSSGSTSSLPPGLRS